MLPTLMIALIAACLTIPIGLKPVLNYETNPAFFLAPVIVLALLYQVKTKTLAIFAAALICGIVSCLIGDWLNHDGELTRHLLSLVLIMFAASFAFLGRWVASRAETGTIVRCLAISSSVFGFVLAAQIVVTGQAFRIEVGPEGYAALNAVFAGLPVFGTFGVLSLAQLLLIQAALCCGLILDRNAPILMQAIAAVGLASLVMLIVRSEARSAQVGLIVLTFAILVIMSFRRNLRSQFMVVGFSAMMAVVAVAASKGPATQRLVETSKILRGTAEVSAIENFEKADTRVATIANGRVALVQAASKDIFASPLIGTGFGPFGRFSNAKPPGSVSQSSSTHVYLLTLLWKGGLLFALPCYGFIAALAFGVWKNRREWLEPNYLGAAAAVVAAFVMSFSWDILIVPSAGALAYFCLGVISVCHAKA